MEGQTRTEVLERFRRKVAEGRPIVGGGAGTGLSAKCAEADAALFAALREGIDTSRVEVHEVDADVNDPAFAVAMADRLHELIQAR